jgi:uncharacterized protein YjbI with pentapeptide repeats
MSGREDIKVRTAATLARAALIGCLVAGTLALIPGTAAATPCPFVDEFGSVTPSPSPGVDWSGCDLSGAHLTFATLSGANLSSANLHNANLGYAYLQGANLAGANLTRASLNHALAAGVDLRGADLSNAELDSADLTSANMMGVNLWDTDLYATLSHVRSGAIIGWPSVLPGPWTLVDGYLIGPEADLSNADLTGATLTGVNLRDANLFGATLINADLSAADLSRADLSHSDLSDAVLRSASLDDANLFGAILTDADLLFADLRDADASGAGMSGVIAFNADLSGANLSSADVTYANLSFADLSNADLHYADLSYADLTGADLTGASTVRVRWTGATCPDSYLAEQHAYGSCVEPLLDTTPPTDAPVVTSTAGTGGWYTSDVSVTWNWSDAGSGIDPAYCTQVSGSSGEGSGVVVASSCQDLAGNSASDAIAFQIDKRAPTVTVSGVTDGAQYVLGSVPVVGCSTTDSTSMVATAASVAVAPGPNAVGTLTATCSGAVDNAGNQASPVSVSYTVIYAFSGFFSPVDNPPVLNVVHGGQGIPVRFSLGGNQGLSIFESGYPKSQQVPCDSSAPVDGIEETVSVGASGLSYNASSGEYSYLWRTEKSWANSCRQFVLKLADGSFHRATFKFR